MGATRVDKIKGLEESIGQKWVYNSYSRYWVDQFQFKVEVGKRFKLFYKNEHLLTLKSLTACQAISTIILNDMIINYRHLFGSEKNKIK